MYILLYLHAWKGECGIIMHVVTVAFHLRNI